MEEQQKRMRREDDEMEEQKWVYDSSQDHKGRRPSRASTGVWKAALFIIVGIIQRNSWELPDLLIGIAGRVTGGVFFFVIEFIERLCYFGISTNLITYLTKVIRQDIKNAARSVNYWVGVTTMMPLIGGFLADSYLGRFNMVLLSSSIYVVGLCLLTMSQLIPSLQPCHVKTCDRARGSHEVVFFLAIYLVSVATGGHKPALESFGADQFDDNHPEERKKKMSYFNWWNSGICCGLFLGVTVIVYMEDRVSWVASYVILTVVMGISIIMFYVGKPFYRYRAPQGSPLTPMLQVLVAAVAKRDLPYPCDPAQLYQVPFSDKNQRSVLLHHTNKLRFLDKAAILENIEDEEDVSSTNRQRSPWRLATVSQVEELKLVVNMVPIWFSTLAFGMSLAQTSTFFIKQGSTMNRKIGDVLEIPPASMFSMAAIAMILSIIIFDRVLEPKLRRVTRKERGITILQRIGIGMVLSMLSMFIASGIERKRLQVAMRHVTVSGGLKGNVVVPMSIFWLAPQFLINGIGDGFALVGMQEFFYDQVPDTMRSLGIALYFSALGIADFISGLLITIVDHLTSTGGAGSWFAKDLNHSRLDKFYFLLGVMNAMNLCLYLFLATKYSYKNVERVVGAADSHGDAVQNKD